MGKVDFAIVSVARATRHVLQSIYAMGSTLSQVTRAIDRLADEQRRLAWSREPEVSTITSEPEKKTMRMTEPSSPSSLKRTLHI